jgi:hypothetical protein
MCEAEDPVLVETFVSEFAVEAVELIAGVRPVKVV